MTDKFNMFVCLTSLVRGLNSRRTCSFPFPNAEQAEMAKQILEVDKELDDKLQRSITTNGCVLEL